MLAPEGGLPSGVAFVGARTHAESVEAHYRYKGRSVVLRLEHPAQSSRAGTDTRTFRIVAPAVHDIRGLIQALARSIEAHEQEFHWEEPLENRPPQPPPPERRALDVQWLAFQAGIKPAIRVSAAAHELEEIESRYRSLGAYVEPSRHQLRLGRQAYWIAYVAHSAREATELKLTEEASVRASDRDAMKLGRLLGYPECCVKAFCSRDRRGKENDWYLAARDAWVARPLPALNVLLLSERRHLVSFEPCTYDCSRALELAERTAEALARVDKPWLDYVMTELARPIAINAAKDRAHIELDGPIGSEPRVVRAWAPEGPDGTSRPGDAALSRQLPGRRVSRRGLIALKRGARPLIAVDFAAGR